MAGSTLARTAHFVLHCVMRDPPVAAPVGALVTAPASLLPDSGQRDADAALMPQPVALAASPWPLFEGCAVWMGAMVPKRWAKRAVTRNTIKRQIYNVSAIAEPSLRHAAHVVRLRAGFDKAAYPSATSVALREAVRVELNQLFAKAACASLRAPHALPAPRP